MNGTIGQIILWAGADRRELRNWMFCNGQLLAIQQNPALFEIIGTIYGGDGRTTFALPNLERVGECHYIICVEGVNPSYK